MAAGGDRGCVQQERRDLVPELQVRVHDMDAWARAPVPRGAQGEGMNEAGGDGVWSFVPMPLAGGGAAAVSYLYMLYLIMLSCQWFEERVFRMLSSQPVAVT